MNALLICFLISFLSWPDLLKAPSPSKPKATWIWDTSLIGTGTGRDEVLQFVRNHQVQRIFLYVNRDISRDAYRTFIQSAARYGIEIHALDGAPDWALPANRKPIADLIRWVKSYNASVQAGERFAGIQVDIEPYLLPEWTSEQSKIVDHWLESLLYFHNEAKKDSTLTTGAAIPFWLDSIQLSGRNVSLAEALIRELDETALMSYRDQGRHVVHLAKNELDWADQHGKNVWIGVEMNPSPDTPFITFYKKSRAYVDSELALIDDLVKRHPSYAGIVVHDYTGWYNHRHRIPVDP